jgi:PAS domain S-box-containing protein
MSIPLRVLNLDDNAAARYTRSRSLERAGFEVLEAATGGEALEMAAANQIDVAVLDVKLPDMSGLEVTQRMRSNPRTRSVRIVQVSAAYLDDSDEISSLQHGADIYLRCPLDPGALSIVVDTLARLRKSEGLQGSSAIAIAHFDLAGYVTRSNQRFCDLLQRTPQQLCSLSLDQLAHREDAAHALESFREMTRGNGQDFRIEMRLVAGDRSVVWTDSSFSLMRSASGIVRGAVAAVIDVTAGHPDHTAAS